MEISRREFFREVIGSTLVYALPGITLTSAKEFGQRYERHYKFRGNVKLWKIPIPGFEIEATLEILINDGSI